MRRHGKAYRAARAAVDRERAYTPVEAIRLLKELATAKFDETIEVHFRLGLNVRHADEQLRGTLMLPHGTGRDVRVAVFAEGEKAQRGGGGRRGRRRRRRSRRRRSRTASPTSTSRSRRPT